MIVVYGLDFIFDPDSVKDKLLMAAELVTKASRKGIHPSVYFVQDVTGIEPHAVTVVALYPYKHEEGEPDREHRAKLEAALRKVLRDPKLEIDNPINLFVHPVEVG